MGMFNAIGQIVDVSTSELPAGSQTGALADVHSKYHKRIVLVGSYFAILGALIGLLISVTLVVYGKVDERIGGLILMPVMLGGAGFLFGMALTCFFAPQEFLTGPVGSLWMALIGTESVVVARVACLLFGVIVTVPFVGLGLLLLLAK